MFVCDWWNWLTGNYLQEVRQLHVKLGVLCFEEDPDDDLELSPAVFFQDEGVLVYGAHVVLERVVQHEDDFVDDGAQVFVVDSPDVDHPPIVEHLFVLACGSLVLPVHCETDP